MPLYREKKATGEISITLLSFFLFVILDFLLENIYLVFILVFLFKASNIFILHFYDLNILKN